MMQKVLFNCSTNVVGGGVKNSAIFIKYALEDTTLNWYFAISPEVQDLITKWGMNCEAENFFLFEDSPGRSKMAKIRLEVLVNKGDFNLVYTMAGPAYAKFSCIHLQGISNPFITHADWDAFSLIGNPFGISRYIIKSAVQLLFSRNADYFVFQTEQARSSYCKRAVISKSRTNVVSNAFDDSLHYDLGIKIERDNTINILCPGAAYTHKAFQFIPEIAKFLKEILKIEFRFILTLPDSKMLVEIEKKALEFGVEGNIINKGPFSYSEINRVYSEADIVFVPSLLETFSASYLEAIAFQKELVVADKGFAKEICGEYANYVNPKNALETANVLKVIIENKDKNTEKSIIGNQVLNRFGSQKERFEKLKQVILKLVEDNRRQSD
jgi:glycosyltransferase involved in cell wall biosynthesis